MVRLTYFFFVAFGVVVKVPLNAVSLLSAVHSMATGLPLYGLPKVQVPDTLT
jgi:hypothetical protein